MCELSLGHSVAQTDIIAYKVVTSSIYNSMGRLSSFSSTGVFHSQYTPGCRGILSCLDNSPKQNIKGSTLKYVVGEETISEDPGIFAYEKLVEAEMCRVNSGERILKILIPAGTIIRTGVLMENSPIRVITAERIRVLEKTDSLPSYYD